MTTWTAKQIEQLKALWAEGKLSASAIASRLGVAGRNSVISKAHRLNLPGRKPRARPGGAAVRKQSAKARRQTPAQSRSSLSKLLGRPPLSGAQVSTAPLVEPAREIAVTLMQLRPRHCRWPVGEEPGQHQLFCGAPKGIEQSYCPYHQAMSCANPAQAAARAAWQARQMRDGAGSLGR